MEQFAQWHFAEAKFTAKRKVDSKTKAIRRRMDWKICIHSPSNQHKTHVLIMQEDCRCDEDFQFETAFWEEV